MVTTKKTTKPMTVERKARAALAATPTTMPKVDHDDEVNGGGRQEEGLHCSNLVDRNDRREQEELVDDAADYASHHPWGAQPAPSSAAPPFRTDDCVDHEGGEKRERLLRTASKTGSSAPRTLAASPLKLQAEFTATTTGNTATTSTNGGGGKKRATAATTETTKEREPTTTMSSAPPPGEEVAAGDRGALQEERRGGGVRSHTVDGHTASVDNGVAIGNPIGRQSGMSREAVARRHRRRRRKDAAAGGSAGGVTGGNASSDCPEVVALLEKDQRGSISTTRRAARTGMTRTMPAARGRLRDTTTSNFREMQMLKGAYCPEAFSSSYEDFGDGHFLQRGHFFSERHLAAAEAHGTLLEQNAARRQYGRRGGYGRHEEMARGKIASNDNNYSRRLDRSATADATYRAPPYEKRRRRRSDREAARRGEHRRTMVTRDENGDRYGTGVSRAEKEQRGGSRDARQDPNQEQRRGFELRWGDIAWTDGRRPFMSSDLHSQQCGRRPPAGATNRTTMWASVWASRAAAGKPQQKWIPKICELGGGKPNRFSRDETLIVFDWDDTLLPSSWIATAAHLTLDPCSIPTPLQQQILEGVAEAACNVLITAVVLGRVLIVTNAEQGWVQLSAAKFMPKVYDLLEHWHIEIISARSTYESPQCPTPFGWKMEAFRQGLSAYFRNFLPPPETTRAAPRRATRRTHPHQHQNMGVAETAAPQKKNFNESSNDAVYDDDSTSASRPPCGSSSSTMTTSSSSRKPKIRNSAATDFLPSATTSLMSPFGRSTSSIIPQQLLRGRSEGPSGGAVATAERWSLWEEEEDGHAQSSSRREADDPHHRRRRRHHHNDDNDDDDDDDGGRCRPLGALASNARDSAGACIGRGSGQSRASSLKASGEICWAAPSSNSAAGTAAVELCWVESTLSRGLQKVIEEEYLEGDDSLATTSRQMTARKMTDEIGSCGGDSKSPLGGVAEESHKGGEEEDGILAASPGTITVDTRGDLITTNVVSEKKKETDIDDDDRDTPDALVVADVQKQSNGDCSAATSEHRGGSQEDQGEKASGLPRSSSMNIGEMTESMNRIFFAAKDHHDDDVQDRAHNVRVVANGEFRDSRRHGGGEVADVTIRKSKVEEKQLSISTTRDEAEDGTDDVAQLLLATLAAESRSERSNDYDDEEEEDSDCRNFQALDSHSDQIAGNRHSKSTRSGTFDSSESYLDAFQQNQHHENYPNHHHEENSDAVSPLKKHETREGAAAGASDMIDKQQHFAASPLPDAAPPLPPPEIRTLTSTKYRQQQQQQQEERPPLEIVDFPGRRNTMSATEAALELMRSAKAVSERLRRRRSTSTAVSLGSRNYSWDLSTTRGLSRIPPLRKRSQALIKLQEAHDIESRRQSNTVLNTSVPTEICRRTSLTEKRFTIKEDGEVEWGRVTTLIMSKGKVVSPVSPTAGNFDDTGVSTATSTGGVEDDVTSSSNNNNNDDDDDEEGCDSVNGAKRRDNSSSHSESSSSDDSSSDDDQVLDFFDLQRRRYGGRKKTKTGGNELSIAEEAQRRKKTRAIQREKNEVAKAKNCAMRRARQKMGMRKRGHAEVHLDVQDVGDGGLRGWFWGLPQQQQQLSASASLSEESQEDELRIVTRRNVLSVGDSESERHALIGNGQGAPGTWCKSIKLVERPEPDDLITAMRTMRYMLAMAVHHSEPLDLMISEWGDVYRNCQGVAVEIDRNFWDIAEPKGLDKDDAKEGDTSHVDQESDDSDNDEDEDDDDDDDEGYGSLRVYSRRMRRDHSPHFRRHPRHQFKKCDHQLRKTPMRDDDDGVEFERFWTVRRSRHHRRDRSRRWTAAPSPPTSQFTPWDGDSRKRDFITAAGNQHHRWDFVEGFFQQVAQAGLLLQ